VYRHSHRQKFLRRPNIIFSTYIIYGFKDTTQYFVKISYGLWQIENKNPLFDIGHIVASA